jgi:hypothetical protein
MEMPLEKRPTCSCGEKMKFVEYEGYYDSFWYWDCDNKDCDLIEEMDNYRPDKKWLGAYA